MLVANVVEFRKSKVKGDLPRDTAMEPQAPSVVVVVVSRNTAVCHSTFTPPTTTPQAIHNTSAHFRLQHGGRLPSHRVAR
jgi:hypothetical protein